MGDKVIFYIRDVFEYEFEVRTYIHVMCLVLVFWNQSKPKFISKPNQNGGKLSHWEVGVGG